MPDWSGVTLETFNLTLLQYPMLCTACTCPLKLEGYQLGIMSYFPSLPGNALFAAIFGLCLVPQIYLGIRHKTWGFLVCMFGGLLLELIGYIARILMRDDMFTDSYFIMQVFPFLSFFFLVVLDSNLQLRFRYLVCLTLAPAFFSAAIYLSLSRLVIIYAPEKARFRPQVYTYIFIACDLVALILQAAGGALASISEFGSPALTAGVNTMIAGLAWQVAGLLLFAALSFEFWMRVRSRNGVQPPLNPVFADLRAQRSFQPYFIVATVFVGVFIFVRSVYRCAELSGGFSGPLANDEITFMVLEGTMIILAAILLTAFHPGLIVGTERWSAASWKKGKQGSLSDTEEAGKEMASSSDQSVL